MRADVYSPLVTSVFNSKIGQDKPERVHGCVLIAAQIRDAVSEVGDPRTRLIYIGRSHTT